MKKRNLALLFILTICLGLVGCSSKKDELTLDDFTTAFSDQGINVDEDNKPLFSMIGASNGVTYSYDDKVVIYVYNSEKDLKKAKEDYEIIKEWNSNGRFLLETNNQDVIDIFNSVK